VEILVVVIILGIASVIVVPMLGNTDDMQVISAARQLASTLLYTQTVSIAAQEQYQVVFDVANKSYEVQDADGKVVADPVASSKQFRVVFGKTSECSKVSFASVNFDGGNKVWFDRMGVPYSGAISDSPPPLTTGQVVMEAGKHQMTVRVEPVTGRISIN